MTQNHDTKSAGYVDLEKPGSHLDGAMMAVCGLRGGAARKRVLDHASRAAQDGQAIK